MLGALILYKIIARGTRNLSGPHPDSSLVSPRNVCTMRPLICSGAGWGAAVDLRFYRRSVQNLSRTPLKLALPSAGGFWNGKPVARFFKNLVVLALSGLLAVFVYPAPPRG